MFQVGNNILAVLGPADQINHISQLNKAISKAETPT